MDRNQRFLLESTAIAPLSPYTEAIQEDKRLDTLYGPDRPKCWICGGRMDMWVPFRRCPFCGAAERGVRG